MVFKLKLKSCLLALLGSAILAFGIYNIHSVSDISEGGVLGLALLIEHWTGISPAISGLVFNITFYFLGWKTFGNNFIGYSIFACGGFSLFYAIFEMFPPIYPAIAEHPLLSSIFGALFVGVGCGLSVRAGGAPTGDDALGMSLSKRLSVNIRWIYLVSDFTVLLLSLTYIPLSKILYSVVTVVISGQIIGFMQKPPSEEEPFLGRYAPLPRDVLVGTLRNTMQLETCLTHNFYHIPAIRLHSGNFPINYVAIYQSIHKFGNDAGVFFYGEVESSRLVKRHEIKEIPKDSAEDYYRFEIKEWKRLENPVLPREGDFINLNTSLFLLKSAKVTSELSLLTEGELELYRRIEGVIKREVSEIRLCGNALKISTSGHNLVLSKNGEVLCSFNVADYNRHSLSCFRKILALIRKEKTKQI